jgi:hypothetical protein
MWWPVLALIGFLLLMAMVIALGTRSTRLYEQAQREQACVTAAAGSIGRDGPRDRRR